MSIERTVSEMTIVKYRSRTTMNSERLRLLLTGALILDQLDNTEELGTNRKTKLTIGIYCSLFFDCSKYLEFDK